MNMGRAYRLRYVNQFVGGFVVLVLLLLVGAAILVGQRQEWFADTFVVFATLEEKDLDGVREGTEVIMLGQRAGRVAVIEYLPNRAWLRLTLVLRQRFADQIYEDSVVAIKRKVAGVGDAYLEITRPGVFDAATARRYELGSPDLLVVAEPPVEDQFRDITRMMDDIRQSFSDVRDAFIPALERWESAGENIERSNEDLQAVIADLRRVTPRLDGLVDQTESVLSGHQQVIDTVRAETDQLPGTVLQLRNTLDGAQEVVDDLRGETQQLPGTVEQFQQTLGGAQEIVEGLRQHWLLRRYIDQHPTSPMIPPSNLGRGSWK